MLFVDQSLASLQIYSTLPIKASTYNFSASSRRERGSKTGKLLVVGCSARLRLLENGPFFLVRASHKGKAHTPKEATRQTLFRT